MKTVLRIQSILFLIYYFLRWLCFAVVAFGVKTFYIHISQNTFLFTMF